MEAFGTSIVCGGIGRSELMLNPKASAPVSYGIGLEFAIIRNKNFEAIITEIRDSQVPDLERA